MTELTTIYPSMAMATAPPPPRVFGQSQAVPPPQSPKEPKSRPKLVLSLEVLCWPLLLPLPLPLLLPSWLLDSPPGRVLAASAPSQSAAHTLLQSVITKSRLQCSRR